MAGLIERFLCICLVAVVAPCVASGSQVRSVRGNTDKVLTRNQPVDSNTKLRRSAMSVIARSASANNRRSRTIVTARPVSLSRSVSNTSTRSGTQVINSKANISRVASSKKSETVRSAAKKSSSLIPNVSRSARATTARLTEMFNDLSKIGGGYASCRDSYATCMDQFCFTADDAFRRCFCSEKYKSYKKISDNMDNVIRQLSDFGNTSLAMIDKSADEVDAMLSATEGENAIREDTSELQKQLDAISDLLYDDAGLEALDTSSQNSSSVSLNLIDFGDFTDLGDIWSGSGSSIFDRRQKGEDLSNMEGEELYNRASNQCSTITRDSCEEKALFDMAYSSYSVLMAQDCHEVERAVEAKREKLRQKVREAETVLRQTRLKYYREHNSKDVNECISKIEKEFTDPMVCGPNYERCLDRGTHEYVYEDGTVNLSKYLFQVDKIKPKLGSSDVVKANRDWDSYLETLKHHAEQALDTCRSLSETVWYEFKTNALFKIAQGLDDKLEETKNSCASTIKECYTGNEKQWKELQTVDDDEKSATYDASALGIMAARGQCYDKVLACASLYGDPEGCVYDKRNKTIKPADGKKCGLQSLLAFVDTVDAAKVANECEDALVEHAKDLCGVGECMPGTENNYGGCVVKVYPAACQLIPKSELKADLISYADTVCGKKFMAEGAALNTLSTDENGNPSSAFTVDIVNRMIKDIFSDLGLAFSSGCEEMDGVWWTAGQLGGSMLTSLTVNDLKKDFYDTYYGGTSLPSLLASVKGGDIGACLDVKLETYCIEGSVGTPDTNKETCALTFEWVQDLCTFLGGNISPDTCKTDTSKCSCTFK